MRFWKREKKLHTAGHGIDPDAFRRVMRHWASGVTVVTTRRGDGIHGMTASSFCSVSLHPPLILVCIDRRHRTCDSVQEQGCFGIHILGEGQEELSRRCAGQVGAAGNQLDGVPHHIGKTGAPILAGCLAHMECQIVHAYEGGDHAILVGEIVDSGCSAAGRPLLYFAGNYHRLMDG